MEMIVTIQGKEYKAELPECDAIRQLAAQLPMEEVFQNSGDHECFCRLGRGVNARGMEGTSDIRKNRIYYFADWKALSFVYKDMSISPFKVVDLGEFKDDVCRVLSEAGSKIRVRLEAV